MKSAEGQKGTDNNSIVSPEEQTFLTMLHDNKDTHLYDTI